MSTNQPEKERHYRSRSAVDAGVTAFPSKMKISEDVEIPPGAHLVQAPYELKQKNDPISRTFLLFKSGIVDPMMPDFRLETKNALIQSAVYTNNQTWTRPVSVHAKTKNADLILEIHTLQADQSISVKTETKNGRNKIFLPRDFKGFLEVSTKNGKCTLSPELKRVAVLLPDRRYEKTIEDDESFELDSDYDTLSNGVGVEYAINGGGPSHAAIDTKNGNVYVGFVPDEKMEHVGCWTNCSIM